MRKTASTSPAQRAGPMWYMASTDYAQKRRSGYYPMPTPVQSINDVDAGQSGRGLVVQIHYQAPQILDMQSACREFPDSVQKWTFYADSSLDESTTDSEEKLRSVAATLPADKPMQSNAQPLIMVEPFVKQNSPAASPPTWNSPAKRTSQPKPEPHSKPESKSHAELETGTELSTDTSLDRTASGLSGPEVIIRDEPSHSTSAASEVETRTRTMNPSNAPKCNCGDSDTEYSECQFRKMDQPAMQPLDELANQHLKQQQGEEEAAQEAEENVDVVAACEVTEAQFISFDKTNAPEPGQLEAEAGRPHSCWNAMQQFYMPAFMPPGQLAQMQHFVDCARKSFRCPHCHPANRMIGNCCKCCVHHQHHQHHQHQQQQQLQQQQKRLQPGKRMAIPCTYCNMCPQQRQPPQPCHGAALTEELAQQLQKQMEQAQAQINRVQMHLNSVRADRHRPIQMATYVGSPAAGGMPKCLDRANMASTAPRCCAQCSMVAVMAGNRAGAGFQPPPRGLPYEPAPSTRSPQQRQQQQVPSQPQRQPQQQQMMSNPIQLAVSGRSRQHCCRQRYAKMRFILPRCWSGAQ